MEQQRQCSSSPAARRDESSEFNLREWGTKARISRENTNSRRHSASFIRSFREDKNTTRLSSFRSNITISSTASSPGYSLRDEIDPSTYSFTTALQALQARSVYNSWECMSPEGFSLNSKWNEAEKYICNPLSGEFPMECLSSKTLSGRSFRNSLTNRITMSAPLLYSQRHSQTRPYYNPPQPPPKFPIQEKRIESMTTTMTRDVGTQSTPPEISSGSLSPASTPSIIERSLNRCSVEAGDSPTSNTKLIISQEQVKVIETEEKEEGREEKKEKENEKQKEENNKQKQRRGNNGNTNGCLSWMTNKNQRHRDKHKPKPKPRNTVLFLLPNLKGC